MSLVSDMLSKVSLPQPTRETPPGLRSDMNQAKKKKVDKKYKLALVASIVFAFMVIIGAMIFRIYVVKSGEHIPADLHKLKTAHKARQAKKGSSESLSEKIEYALLAAEKEKESLDSSKGPEKKKVFTKTPPPALVAAAAVEGEGTGEDAAPGNINPLGIVKTSGKAVGLNDKTESPDTAEADAEAPAVIEEAMPVLGSKQTYHHLYKAIRSEKSNEYVNAIAIYDEILKIEPKNHIIMNKIASLLMKMDMWKEAMDRLRESYKLKDDYIPALINIGIVYANTGNYSRSEKYLHKALAADPIDVNAIFTMALLYEKQNRFNQAAAYYARLQKLGDPRGGSGLERVLDN